jgi:hypothetical protein
MGFLLSQPGRLARHAAILVLGFGALCACEPEQTSNYEPRSAVQPDGRSVEHAIRFYDQDLPAIYQAGGRIIGDLQVNGNVASSFDDVDDDALAQAAERGGTHLIRTSKDVQRIFWQLSRARKDTDCISAPGSAHCSTVYSDAAFAKIAELPSAHYTILVVPCENWGRLPNELRPKSTRGCDQFDPTLVVKTVSRKRTPVARDGQRATPDPSTTGAPDETQETPQVPTDDFIDESCRMDRGRGRSPAFSRTGAARAFQAAELESLKCDWSDHSVTLVITFGQAGCVHQIHVDDEDRDQKFDACLSQAFSSVTVPAFRGKAVTVSKVLGAESP